MERKYSVSEIDALRLVLDNHYLFGVYDIKHAQSGNSRVYMASEKTAAVEGKIRTYMLAGLTADDLLQDERVRRSSGAHREIG